MESTVYIGFGGNLGDVLTTFSTAHARISRLVGHPTGFSSIYCSKALVAPEDPQKDKPPYYNCCGRYLTMLSPDELLSTLLNIEKELGRLRGNEPRWASRAIDLDILLFGQKIIEKHDLIIPHPRLTERDFCLEPLVEIDIELKHPITGETLSCILERLPESQRFVTRIIPCNFSSTH